MLPWQPVLYLFFSTMVFFYYSRKKSANVLILGKSTLKKMILTKNLGSTLPRRAIGITSRFCLCVLYRLEYMYMFYAKSKIIQYRNWKVLDISNLHMPNWNYDFTSSQIMIFKKMFICYPCYPSIWNTKENKYFYWILIKSNFVNFVKKIIFLSISNWWITWITYEHFFKYHNLGRCKIVISIWHMQIWNIQNFPITILI